MCGFTAGWSPDQRPFKPCGSYLAVVHCHALRIKAELCRRTGVALAAQLHLDARERGQADVGPPAAT